MTAADYRFLIILAILLLAVGQLAVTFLGGA